MPLDLGSLLGQKKHAEAERLLLAGYEGMKQREEKIPPQGKLRLTEALERLVQLCDAWGQKEKADAWRRKLPVAKSAKPAEARIDRWLMKSSRQATPGPASLEWVVRSGKKPHSRRV